MRVTKEGFPPDKGYPKIITGVMEKKANKESGTG